MLVWLLQRSEPTPHDNDGNQRFFRTGMVAEALSQAGHDVVWWTSTFDHYNRRQRFFSHQRKNVRDNYTIQYIKGCGYTRNISYARIRENNSIAKGFSKLAEREAALPDVIVTSLPTAELCYEAIRFAEPKHIPVILDIRDLWPDFLFEAVPSFCRPLVTIGLFPLIRKTNWVFQNADAVIGLTDEFVAWGMEYAKRARGYADRVFPMGYIRKPLSLADQAAGNTFWEENHIIANDDFLNVIFVGSMGRTSDLFVVLQAARMLNDRGVPIRFILCGHGENYAALKEVGDGLGNVVMPGWINDIQIRMLLKKSHVGLAPYIASPNYIKNLPNKPAEYMSEGLAVATSLVSGPLVDLIDQNCCGFSYFNNPNILAEKLTDYIDGSDVMEVRKNAMSVFKSFLDGEKIYSDMIDYLEEMASDCKRPNTYENN